MNPRCVNCLIFSSNISKATMRPPMPCVWPICERWNTSITRCLFIFLMLCLAVFAIHINTRMVSMHFQSGLSDMRNKLRSGFLTLNFKLAKHIILGTLILRIIRRKIACPARLYYDHAFLGVSTLLLRITSVPFNIFTFIVGQDRV